MTQLSQLDELDLPPWLAQAATWAWHNRRAVGIAACIALVLVSGWLGWIGIFQPSDLEQARADIRAANRVIEQFDAEAIALAKEVAIHTDGHEEVKAGLAKNRATGDKAWLARNEAAAMELSFLANAKWRRRNTLLERAAEFHELVAQAQVKLIFAEACYDKGKPRDVASDVHELLAPVLSHRTFSEMRRFRQHP